MRECQYIFVNKIIGTVLAFRLPHFSSSLSLSLLLLLLLPPPSLWPEMPSLILWNRPFLRSPLLFALHAGAGVMPLVLPGEWLWLELRVPVLTTPPSACFSTFWPDEWLFWSWLHGCSTGLEH